MSDVFYHFMKARGLSVTAIQPRTVVHRPISIAAVFEPRPAVALEYFRANGLVSHHDARMCLMRR